MNLDPNYDPDATNDSGLYESLDFTNSFLADERNISEYLEATMSNNRDNSRGSISQSRDATMDNNREGNQSILRNHLLNEINGHDIAPRRFIPTPDEVIDTFFPRDTTMNHERRHHDPKNVDNLMNQVNNTKTVQVPAKIDLPNEIDRYNGPDRHIYYTISAAEEAAERIKGFPTPPNSQEITAKGWFIKNQANIHKKMSEVFKNVIKPERKEIIDLFKYLNTIVPKTLSKETYPLIGIFVEYINTFSNPIWLGDDPKSKKTKKKNYDENDSDSDNNKEEQKKLAKIKEGEGIEYAYSSLDRSQFNNCFKLFIINGHITKELISREGLWGWDKDAWFQGGFFKQILLLNIIKILCDPLEAQSKHLIVAIPGRVEFLSRCMHYFTTMATRKQIQEYVIYNNSVQYELEQYEDIVPLDILKIFMAFSCAAKEGLHRANNEKYKAFRNIMRFKKGRFYFPEYAVKALIRAVSDTKWYRKIPQDKPETLRKELTSLASCFAIAFEVMKTMTLVTLREKTPIQVLTRLENFISLGIEVIKYVRVQNQNTGKFENDLQGSVLKSMLHIADTQEEEEEVIKLINLVYARNLNKLYSYSDIPKELDTRINELYRKFIIFGHIKPQLPNLDPRYSMLNKTIKYAESGKMSDIINNIPRSAFMAAFKFNESSMKEIERNYEALAILAREKMLNSLTLEKGTVLNFIEIIINIGEKCLRTTDELKKEEEEKKKENKKMKKEKKKKSGQNDPVTERAFIAFSQRVRYEVNMEAVTTDSRKVFFSALLEYIARGRLIASKLMEDDVYNSVRVIQSSLNELLYRAYNKLYRLNDLLDCMMSLSQNYWTYYRLFSYKDGEPDRTYEWARTKSAPEKVFNELCRNPLGTITCIVNDTLFFAGMCDEMKEKIKENGKEEGILKSTFYRIQSIFIKAFIVYSHQLYKKFKAAGAESTFVYYVEQIYHLNNKLTDAGCKLSAEYANNPIWKLCMIMIEHKAGKNLAREFDKIDKMKEDIFNES
jgi:hypothetical protein